MSMNNPKITVLMPVYNSEKYLKEAIDSILSQTFKDFEFLIIADFCSDSSIDIIKSYNDSRINLIQNEQSLGLVNSLNLGLNIAKGEYIARMDSDDISMTCRLEKQVKFLEKNKNIDVCGSLIKTFGNVNSSVFRYPEKHDLIKATLLFKCSVAHPSIMLRKSAFSELFFDSEFKHAEDYELWTRASEQVKFFNMQEVLLHYRMHNNQASQAFCENHNTFVSKVIKKQFSSLDYSPSEEELELHQRIGLGNIISSKDFVNKAENWLIRLKNLNNKTKYYREPDFSFVVAEEWFLVCIKSAQLGLWSFLKFFISELSKKNNLSFKSKWKLFTKCLKK